MDVKNFIFDFDKEIAILLDLDEYNDHLKEFIVKPKSVMISVHS